MILPLLAALLFGRIPQTAPQAIGLDDFEEISGWKAIVSEGAVLTLHRGDGKIGAALLMEFDLTGGVYAIADKAFAIDLPDTYQFKFLLREVRLNVRAESLSGDATVVLQTLPSNVEFLYW